MTDSFKYFFMGFVLKYPAQFKSCETDFLEL